MALVIFALAGLAISVGAAPVPPPTTDASDCVIQRWVAYWVRKISMRQGRRRSICMEIEALFGFSSYLLEISAFVAMKSPLTTRDLAIFKVGGCQWLAGDPIRQEDIQRNATSWGWIEHIPFMP
ncbi:hypothetical protein C8Q73DRAFT_664972 [Cubamyces lactineus]|nr:hypothetical protein C8Q73DRAFT_664972 [Cubamyces lactineus]